MVCVRVYKVFSNFLCGFKEIHYLCIAIAM